MNPSLIIKNRIIKISLSFVLFPILLSFFLLFFSTSCRLYILERKLDPVNAEFLSEVRYIITSKERKKFLDLPDSEKKEFKEEFWERRDPDPYTPENEFKMEYFDRIEKATELFRIEGRPGWMTDRGRIHILFGPPSFREIHYSESSDLSGLLRGRCGEIWHYGLFPVVFRDESCNGIKFELITYDLTSLSSINLMYMHELTVAQEAAQKTFKEEKDFFDFRLSLKKIAVERDRFEGMIVIEVPYGAIWYKSKDDMLETTLDVHVTLNDFEDNRVWEYENAFEISMKEDELQDKQKEKYKIEIYFTLEKDLERLRQGKNLIHAVVKNRNGDERLKKVMGFRL